jgi:hypothetical protein
MPNRIPRWRPTNAKNATIPTAPLTTNTKGQICPRRLEFCGQLRRSSASVQTPKGTRTSDTKSATAFRPRDTSLYPSVRRNNLRGDMASQDA